MEGRSDMDRITKLPESILLQILSSLLVKDVARMSTLSKVLYSAWNEHSYLDFGSNFFRESEDTPKLLKVVDKILANRLKKKISIQKFCIESLHPRWISYVDKWINKLVACNIKELHLRVVRPIYEGVHEYNELPESIFAAKALNMLSLDGFKMELPSNGIKFSSLREFYLNNIFLDDQFIQALCTSCCHLEVLSLQNCEGLASFQVGDILHKLKTVKLDHCHAQFQMVDIVATSLEYLNICSLSGDLKLVKITACKALKTLFLNGVDVPGEWLEELFSNLPNVETFSFSSKTLKTMKFTSRRLKWLTVFLCDSLIAVEIDTPNLMKFQYMGNPLSAFNMKASALLDAIFYLCPIDLEMVDCHWHSKLMKLLGNFNHSKAIEFYCHHDKLIVIPKDMREKFTAPLYGTNNLRVNLEHSLNYSLVDILDSMLWISPHLDTLSFMLGPGLKTLKFIYEDVSDEDVKPCCASLPWKCWRHMLKTVKLQNFTSVEQEDLKNYFLKNANIVEMIEISPDCRV